MCGRTACTLAPASIEDRYKPKDGFRNKGDYHPSFNIGPFGKAYLPVLSLQQDGTTDLAAMRWGLIPVWQKDDVASNDDPKSFNARIGIYSPHIPAPPNAHFIHIRSLILLASSPSPSYILVETMKEKKMFKRLLANKRCVVLLDGFYEWTKDGMKQPYPTLLIL